MIPKSIAKELIGVVGEDHALTEEVDLACYAYDSTHYTHHPDLVLMPGGTAEVSAILRIANRERIPVVPRGSGTSLSGGTTPIHGGIVLHMVRMNRILRVDAPNRLAEVEPGVITVDFQRRVEQLGLFYPPDPSSLSVSTLGGNVGESAGGPRGVKYGSTKDYVLGLEVVLADGQVLHTGGKAAKNSSGYNLTSLFVGSEGTLGVITRILLKLLTLPEAKQTASAVFDSLDSAADAVAAIIAARIVPTTLELIDNFTVRRIQSFKPAGLPVDAEGILLMEVDGFRDEVAHQVEVVADIARRCGALEVKVARTREENDQLWAARRSAYAALAVARPTAIVEDATVPRNRIPAMVRATQELARKYRLEVTVLAHAGDGNMHPVVLCDWRDREEMERVDRFSDELFHAAIEMGGTLSGEHGIGLAKSKFMRWQHGGGGIETMRRIKRVFDPNTILNPGKMLPD